jgi:hypothetical protein
MKTIAWQRVLVINQAKEFTHRFDAKDDRHFASLTRLRRAVHELERREKARAK